MGVPAAASASARATIRFASSILKLLSSPDALASARATSAACRKTGSSTGEPMSDSSAARARQGFGSDPAKGDSSLSDISGFDIERDCGRNDGECIRGAFAKLQIARIGGKGSRFRRQPDGDDEVAGLEAAFQLWCVSRQAVQILDPDFTPASPAFDFDDGIQRHQGHAEIGRVGGDAGFAPAQHRMKSVVAMTGTAAGSRPAFVAGAGRVVEIRTAGPLQQIAADRRSVAQLRRSA